MNSIKLMSHMVAGYPSDELSLTAARSLIKGGASILEVQLAFSDPSADGPAIQKACSEVLSRGCRTDDGLSLIKKIHTEFPAVPIYIMSYASLIYTPGVDAFCKKAAEAGVKGMIIPDLPFDHDEGLTAACKKYGMQNIPVAAPSMAENRLNKMINAGFESIYATLRTGITGSKTTIDKKIIDFIKKAGSKGAKILGGFGIENGEQSEALAKHVYAVVAGSVFVRIITEKSGSPEKIAKALQQKAGELSGSCQ